MKINKKELDEIVDSDGELIGRDSAPSSGSNLETSANNTTDYNAKISHQPYRYDMLGRFGFTLLPFFEGEEGEKPNKLIEDLASHLFEWYKEILKYYFKNPNKLKSDYHKVSKQDYETGSEKYGFDAAEEILNIIKPHFEDSLKDLNENLKENINESEFVEGKVLDDIDRRDLKNKEDVKDRELLDKKISRIAGLINKMDDNSKNKILDVLDPK